MPQRSGLRLFFALWPAPALRAALVALAARLRTDCGGRAPRQCPPELSALAQALSDGLRARGFAVEHRAFKPHVTLLRDISAPPPQSDCHALHWRARSIVLACSEPAPRGVRYRVVGEWPLTGG